MYKNFLVLGFLLSSMVLASCRTVPMANIEDDSKAKNFSTKPNKAQIYIYRNEMIGAAIKIDVNLDGQLVGRTLSDTYLLLEVPPGKHTIMSEAENKSSLDIDAAKGKSYFIWQEVKMGFWLARSELHSVDESTGKAGVRECKMIQKTGL